MTDIKDIVDEAILESHLIGLTERQIWGDLEYFSRCCEKVIREHVKDEASLAELAEKLAMARKCTLVNEPTDVSESLSDASDDLRSPRERFVQRAARNKRLILRAIEEYDPQLVALIQGELFRVLPQKKHRRWTVLDPRIKMLVLRISYVVMVICLFLLVYLMILEQR
jgi:hypothetical protein